MKNNYVSGIFFMLKIAHFIFILTSIFFLSTSDIPKYRYKTEMRKIMCSDQISIKIQDF